MIDLISNMKESSLFVLIRDFFYVVLYGEYPVQCRIFYKVRQWYITFMRGCIFQVIATYIKNVIVEKNARDIVRIFCVIY